MKNDTQQKIIHSVDGFAFVMIFIRVTLVAIFALTSTVNARYLFSHLINWPES